MISRFPFFWLLTAAAMIAIFSTASLSSVAAQQGSTVSISGNEALGSFLVGPNGMTLYVFTNDTPGESVCFDQCEQNWPALVVADGETPTTAPGVAGALTIFERPDGSRQVLLDGQPLYYWAFDEAAGDAKGHGVGGVWFVVSAATDSEVLRVGTSPALGPVLTGPNGMTLYVFANDTAGESVCYGQCESNWPPLIIADGETPTAAPGVTAGALGTTARDDGMIQVTLDDRPLYYWAFDQAVGDSTGHGVGTVWFALDASGARHPFVAAEEPTPTGGDTTPTVPDTGGAGLVGNGSDDGSFVSTQFVVLGAGFVLLVIGFASFAGSRRRQ